MFIYKKLLSNPTVDSNFWRRAVEVYSILHVLGALYYFLKDVQWVQNLSKVACTKIPKIFIQTFCFTYVLQCTIGQYQKYLIKL